MKKLIFLLLFAPFLAFGQSSPIDPEAVYTDLIESLTTDGDLPISGNGTGVPSITDGLKLNYATASTLAYLNGSKVFTSLANGSGFLKNNGSGTLSYSTVALASEVSGTLPYTNGGTGLSALGTALQQLRVNAGATALEYFTPAAALTFGTDNQIPYVNAGGTDFDYGNLTFDGTIGNVTGNWDVSGYVEAGNLRMTTNTLSSSTGDVTMNPTDQVNFSNKPAENISSLWIGSNASAASYPQTILTTTAIQNYSSAADYISMTPQQIIARGDASGEYFNLQSAISNDIGTEAAFRFTASNGSAAYATRPTFAWYNYTTKQLEVSAANVWNYQGGTISNAVGSGITGVPISTGVSGLGANVAAFLGAASSANLLAAVTDETGTGALVFGTSPTFTTGITSPLIIGGTGTTSTLTYKTTTGIGATGADHVWVGGTDGATEFMRILNSGNMGVGVSAPLQKVHIKTPNGTNGAVIGNFLHDYYGLAVESEDAVLGLISKDEGGHGSGVDLMEVDGGVLADKWWIGRWSSGTVGTGDSRLEFTYGTSADYTANPRRFTIYKDNKAAFYDGSTTTYQVGIGTGTLNSLELAFGASSGQIGTDSDTKRMSYGGGTAPNVSNGGFINVHGNSFTGQEGDVSLVAGNTATSGEIKFFTGSLSDRGGIAYGGAWSTNGNSLTAGSFSVSALNSAPASAGATGTTGEIRITADYIYVCVATNTWKRVAIATW